MELNQDDLSEIIEQHNPFFMKSPKGKICYFEDYVAVYLKTLRLLREQFPKGYIEMVLFLNDNCKTGISYGRELVRGWKREGYEGDPVLVEWNSNGVERYYTLRLLMKCLHTLSGTSFKEDMFKVALEKFDAMFVKK